MRIHAFHHLYQHRLSLSTRPFKARGCKVVRCEYCKIEQGHCICEHQPDIKTNVATMLILSDNEVLKPSNTGRLIVDTVKDSHVYLWHRTEPNPEMLAVLKDEKYQPVIVFPEDYTDDKSRVVQDLPAMRDSNKTLLLIFIDGSWREARRIFRRSEYLQHLPVLSIEPESVSQYMMRKSDNEQHLSTAEVASLVLKQAGEEQGAKTLQMWFEAFRESYMLSKTRYKSDQTKPSLNAYIDYRESETSL
ncbi:tRNA-uridine aminocarboxypropyltransferase [Vibrio sp. Isolate30]|uniref:tRNA-uridine aminocarboxypropyltransferase n=1 Tax=Vibrio sp. Isolate30 TaxID=2908536 RepID=UPI001EFCAB4D|nr:tRNA-uridine aminocarboxypropyltransferase [Vibrio sp. Isolate30]MCG9631068.1 DTW domain-containing protein [Vibrio sp. Isolate30]